LKIPEKQNFFRWLIIIASFIIVVMILWNTYAFFQIFKNDERVKMEHWAEAQKSLNKADVNTDIELPLKIIQNTRIPIIIVQNNVIVNSKNIDESIIIDNIVKNKSKAEALLLELKNQNNPIKMEFAPGKFQFFYYGDSSLLKSLKYYPIALLLIILLFVLLVYNFYRSTKMAAQNKLWAGMAKETAHQIGTPLSSLIGWVEIMKANHVDETMIFEIEKDISRLQTITDRFSKIGSEPVLQILDIVEETQKTYEYLQARFSKQIEFTLALPKNPILIAINPELHSWTIENLVKNSIDAMKGKGKLKIKIDADEFNLVKILVSDTGKGIAKKQFKQIFEPGFTTKKRGWGLGLSLTKRIVEEYHKGKIKVQSSEINKGTTIEIVYKKFSQKI
jgi:two-component system, sporulation sensor kinase D